MTNCEVGTEGDIESDGENEAAEVKLQGFAGMGDVIGKILDKSIPNNSNNVILCKSKKSKKRKLQVKEEHDAKKEKQEKLTESRELNHIVPTRGNAQKEVVLKRIATKGVVKLLNAVSQHQKTVSQKMKEERTEAGKDKVADKVTKSDFMELLKKKPSEKLNVKQKKKVFEKQDVKDEEEEENSADTKWSVLREDFMMGSSLKDWDKVQSENENDEEEESDGDDEESSTDDEKG